MNNRQKKKLAKRLDQKEVVVINPVFCRINANDQQLEGIGCPLGLNGVIAEYIKDYSTGYSEVKVENKELTEALGEKIFNFYDIPKIWLKFEK